MSIPINVKWGKESYDIEINPSEGLEALQGQLFSLTNVPIERQKLMIKGKFIKDNTELAKLTSGAKLMLMGSADTLPAAPSKPIVFEEDLNESQKLKLDPNKAPSSGLVNLGNTCYMNSTLQTFRVIPEFKESLIKFARKPNHNIGDKDESVITQLGLLLNKLDSTEQPVTPDAFTYVFRSAFPQFAEKNSEGHFAQQDSDEALTQLMTAVGQKAGPYSNEIKETIIDYVFGGEMASILRCTETDKEPIRKTSEKFTKLRCSIDEKTNFMFQGIERELKETTERRSDVLARNAIWKKTSRITKLPRYMIVQFVRFGWRSDTNKKSKILKKVEFPIKFDVVDFLAPTLKRSIMAARRAIKDEEDKKLGLASLNKSTSKNMDKIREQAKKNLEKEAAAKALKAEKEAKEKKDNNKEVEVIDDWAVNFDENEPIESPETSGFYDLVGVVTHQGRTADSGHYIGWSRTNVNSDNWMKYDDDKVTTVNTDQVKALCGGGDWHMCYLLTYKRNDDFKGKSLPMKQSPATTETSTTATATSTASENSTNNNNNPNNTSSASSDSNRKNSSDMTDDPPK